MENDIKSQIDEMTAVTKVEPSAQAVLQPMDWLGRLLMKWRIRHLPKAQRLLHYGLPVVTGKQLADRLGVKAFNKRGGFGNEVIKACLDKKGHPIEDCTVTKVSVYTSLGGGACFWTYKGSEYAESMEKTWPSVEVIATVKTERLDSYCLEKIPDRCLSHIQTALSFGLDRRKIMVAYPIVEEVKRPDPIVVYPINQIDGDDGIYLEITMWE